MKYKIHGRPGKRGKREEKERKKRGKRKEGCVLLIYKSGARPQVWDCGWSVMWMAQRFCSNINHWIFNETDNAGLSLECGIKLYICPIFYLWHCTGQNLVKNYIFTKLFHQALPQEVWERNAMREQDKILSGDWLNNEHTKRPRLLNSQPLQCGCF